MGLRNPNVAPVLRSHDPETPTDEESADTDWQSIFVTDAETAAALDFADVEGVSHAKQFLEETDFESETVYVEQRRIGECYEQRLCWIRWTESSVETSYATGYRDADVACSAESNDVVAVLVRLPVALDADRIRSRCTRTSTGSCQSLAVGERKP
ncbi:hypothetical protein [Haloprofundus halobius]|uniref:hypothetical protein n=1 Tax=Haloprofundus halobius TaxID=2876194 RepID=UPI001CCD8A67|nr:hypothetical protein [Haloprofundus halobius]